MFANAASNSTIYNTASQIKRTVVHASTADDMTCQQDGALHINLPASPPREHLLYLLRVLQALQDKNCKLIDFVD